MLPSLFPKLQVDEVGVTGLLGGIDEVLLSVSTALIVFWTVCGVGTDGIPADCPVEPTVAEPEGCKCV